MTCRTGSCFHVRCCSAAARFEEVVERVVAAAHLKRYGPAPRVSPGYADAGAVDWIICWPDHLDAGRLVLRAALGRLRGWRVRVWYVDGSLPCLGVYGISDSWPPVLALVGEAGFQDRDGQVEIVFAGRLADVEPPGPPPLDALVVRRVLGSLGTTFQAVVGDEVVGIFEVDDDHTRGGSVMGLDGWADEVNHWVRQGLRGRGLGSWLFRHGCAWLELGGTRRILLRAGEREPPTDRALLRAPLPHPRQPHSTRLDAITGLSPGP